MITTDDAVFEMQFKSWFNLLESNVPFSRYSIFCITNYPRNFKNCGVITSLCTQVKKYFEYLLNLKDIFIDNIFRKYFV